MASRIELTREIPQSVVTAGEILNNIERPVVARSPVFNVPVTWGDVRLPTKAKLSQEYSRPGALNQTDLPFIQPQLFDTAQAVLEQTISALSGGRINQLESLRIQKIQFGHLAYIFLCEAKVGGKPNRFVTYLARGPYEHGDPETSGESLSAIADNDFGSLQYLSRQFENLLSQNVRQRFDVIKPITSGNMTFNNEHYALFTMPFVPYGELGLESQEFIMSSRPYDPIHMLYFKYAKPYNKEMLKVARNQAEAVKRRGKVLLFGKHTPEQMVVHPDVLSYYRQKEDYILADMLVHMVSGGMFPREHMITAGDWMGVISDKGLRMKLITVRGKLTPVSKGQFLRYLSTHTEMLWTGHSDADVPVFADVHPRRLEELYSEAERILNS